MAAFWFLAGADYTEARRLIANPVIAVLLVLTIVNFAVHMRLGAQVIIEDYVHRPVLKPVLLMANTGLAYVAAIIGVLATVRIAVTG
jgi:succinate dehydrogenase / fumarate reductase membrane anchor subunit